jgi:hypothetical protein
MFAFVKSTTDRILTISHHSSCGLTGAIAFGFAAWLLDIGGFRTSASVTGGISHQALYAIGSIIVVFAGVDMLMKRLTGKPGTF